MFEQLYYWWMLRNVRVLFIGESHGLEDRLRFAKIVPLLKRSGVKAIGLELWRDHQQVVDDYLSDGKNTIGLVSFLKDWEDRGVEEIAALKKVIDEIKEHKLQIFLFDLSKKDRRGHLREDDDVNGSKRHARMGEYIREKSREFDKVVIFVGGFHLSEQYFQKPLQEFLREEGIKYKTIVWYE